MKRVVIWAGEETSTWWIVMTRVGCWAWSSFWRVVMDVGIDE